MVIPSESGFADEPRDLLFVFSAVAPSFALVPPLSVLVSPVVPLSPRSPAFLAYILSTALYNAAANCSRHD